MPTTTNSALRYPTSGDAPNVPQFIQNLATDVDTKMPRGALCQPITLAGSLGASGNGLAVGATPSLTVGSNRLLAVSADFQVYIPSGNGQLVYVWFERWVGGSLVSQFGGKSYRVTTGDSYDIRIEDEQQITTAGSYVWKVVGTMSGSATATVDDVAPTGSVPRVRKLRVRDVGPIPAI